MSLLKEGSLYVLGELINKAMPFLLIPFLTKSLGAQGYGELAFYQVIVAVVSLFIGMSQDGAISRCYYHYGRRVVYYISITGISFSLIICSMLCFSFYFFNFKAEYLLCILLATLSCLMGAQLSLKQCQRRVKIYFLAQAINAVLTTLLVVLFFTYKCASVTYFLFSSSIGTFVALFFLLANDYKKILSIRINNNYFKHSFFYLFGYGLPLILHQIGLLSKGQVDRLLIYAKFSPESLGVYAVGSQIATMYLVFLMILNKTLLPYYYSALKDGRMNRNKVLYYCRLSFLSIFIPAVFFMCIPSSIYDFLLGVQFHGVKYFIVLFAICFGLNAPYLILVNYFFYHGRNKVIGVISISSALIYVILVYLFSEVDIKYIPLSLFVSNLYMIIVLYYSLIKNEEKNVNT
ncbi:oligosaccharide flippase family protein [Pectobacterium sp. CHL-2024]|uniref:oligosaccharide flippase family protein n=1 Tax=Pectobacterium sp. CHL-2024 TaxID=3377079 RepID=UPI0037F1FC31